MEQFSQQPKSSTTGSGRFGHSVVCNTQAVARWAAAVALGVAERLLPATTSVPSVSGGGRVVAVSTGGPRGASGYRLIERAKRGTGKDQKDTGEE